MKEDMFDVLMYLFEHYYIDEDTEPRPDRESLHSELMEAGFPSNDINQAFEWLEGLSVQQHQIQAPQTENAIRIYSARECERLDSESRGFLLFLEQMGILPPDARERVVERVDVELPEEVRQFVYERDVDVALGVFDNLGSLGHLDAAGSICPCRDDARVAVVDEFGGLWG